MMSTCKICKLAPKYPGLLDFVNNQLRNGKSYRKIQKMIITKFTIPISHESVRIHDLHWFRGEELKNKKQDYPIYIKITKIKSRY